MEKINIAMKTKIHIASCSFGKDSIATILLALEHNEPLDRVVFAEVMFDHERNISGEIPEHIEWIYNTAMPRLESMGVKVDVVRAPRDYKWYFSHKIQRGERKGKFSGFPLGGMCFINRDCKVRAIKKYYKHLAEDHEVVQYIGIASDEPKRLARLKEGCTSLLQKYQYTEQMAYDLCSEHNLLSPIYANRSRGGCWFCPNAKIHELAHLYTNHPHLWAELRELADTPNLASYGFRYGKTVAEVERWFNDRQLDFKY